MSDPSPDAPTTVLPRISDRGRWALPSFFALAYGISWTAWLIGLARTGPPFQMDEAFVPYLFVGSLGPTIAAVAVTARVDGVRGLARLGRALVRVRVRFSVYLVALLLLPLTFAAGLAALGIRPVATEDPALVWLTVTVAVPVNLVFALLPPSAGPLGEELGWRGFALPRLLAGRGDLAASALLGVGWAYWHLPLFAFDSWRGDVDLPVYLLLYPIGTITVAYMMTKLWRWSHGSVLLAILFHGAVNQVAANFGADLFELGPFAAPLAVALVQAGLFAVTAGVFALLARTVYRRYERPRVPARPRIVERSPDVRGRRRHSRARSG